MKHAINSRIFVTLLAVMFLTACDKTDYIPEKPGTPSLPTTPNNPGNLPGVDSTVVNLRMAIRIGEVVYDSIPFTADITSFSGATQVNHQNFNLKIGTNRLVLMGTHDRYIIKVSKWGITDEMTLTKVQLKDRGVIIMGGSKAAKKLTMEESFTLADAGTFAQGKTLYKYDGAGRLIRAIYYQKKPQQADLQLTLVDKFVYESNGKLDRIDRFDAFRDTTVVPASFTAFNYDAQGRVVEIYNNQTTETAARVRYGIENRYATTSIDYFYDNNASLSYTMKFLGGNKVADGVRSSRGDSEGGTYTYDTNINPYVHMAWPDLYLSHESKNNVVAQQKSYAGAYPSGDPYKMEYRYDSDGYPLEKVTTYKSVFTGADVYRIKTVYTY